MAFNKPDITQLSALGSTTGDVYFPQTKLLLPFDGANGATTTSDLSNTNRTVTFYGTAQLSTAQSKFGGSSLLLDGNSDYLTVPHVSSDIVTELTLETWFKTSSSAFQTLIGSWNQTSNTGSYIQMDGGTPNGGVNGSYQITSSSGGYADGNWHHVALTRNTSNLVTLWLDGVSKATTTDSTALPTSPFYIGRLAHSSIIRYFDGYLDDVRWTPSVCRYTSNFTPPTSAHLTSAGDANKQILINSAADGVAIGTGGINQARIAKAWAQFEMTGHTVADSYNVSSITDIATGSCYINFSTSMSGTDYACATSGATYSGGATNYSNGAIADTAARARWYRESAGGAGHDTGLACSIIVFGN
jgi:hypothetical protein